MKPHKSKLRTSTRDDAPDPQWEHYWNVIVPQVRANEDKVVAKAQQWWRDNHEHSND